MRNKKDKAAHEPEDEAGHDVNTETSKKVELDEELVKELKLRSDVQEVCAKLISRFQVSPIYSVEDLVQDVIIKFGKWFPSFRGESSRSTALYAIAYNQLVDQFRDPENKAPHWEDLGVADKDGQRRAIGEPPNRYFENSQNVEADAADFGVLLKELESKLNSRELSLYTQYFIEGWTETEIAKALGVTRQAIYKRIRRISAKMRSFVDQQNSTGSTPNSLRRNQVGSQVRGLR